MTSKAEGGRSRTSSASVSNGRYPSPQSGQCRSDSSRASGTSRRISSGGSGARPWGSGLLGGGADGAGGGGGAEGVGGTGGAPGDPCAFESGSGRRSVFGSRN